MHGYTAHNEAAEKVLKYTMNKKKIDNELNL